MRSAFWRPTTMTISIEGGDVEMRIARPAPTADAFQYADWARGLQTDLEQAKYFFDNSATHSSKLSMMLAYLTRLRQYLQLLPQIDGEQSPLKALCSEIDLLVHHRKSELLRPIEAATRATTSASQTFRVMAVLCVQVYLKGGLKVAEARKKVADALWSKGYRGDKGRFGPTELKNWISQVSNGDLPGSDFIENLLSSFPGIDTVASEAEARDAVDMIITQIKLPPQPWAQAKKDQPLI